jgi:hypothetical protein
MLGHVSLTRSRSPLPQTGRAQRGARDEHSERHWQSNGPPSRVAVVEWHTPCSRWAPRRTARASAPLRALHHESRRACSFGGFLRPPNPSQEPGPRQVLRPLHDSQVKGAQLPGLFGRRSHREKPCDNITREPADSSVCLDARREPLRRRDPNRSLERLGARSTMRSSPWVRALAAMRCFAPWPARYRTEVQDQIFARHSADGAAAEGRQAGDDRGGAVAPLPRAR